MNQDLSRFRILANIFSKCIKIRDEWKAKLFAELDKAKTASKFLSRKTQESSDTFFSAPAVTKKFLHTQNSMPLKELSDRRMSLEVSGYFAIFF